MTKQFNGTIALDIRDSVPDWEPYAEPKAPKGSPNILYLVIDDTGFGAWEMFGGKIKMPNLNRIARKGLVYTNFHTTALCSPTRSSLLNGRNATSNGMSCIEEATSGFPGNNGRIPFENALIPAVLSERGYNTFALGKWHLLPEEEANMAASKRNWPLGRGFERYYGFLGGETDQWYPDLVYDNHLIEPPYAPDLSDTEKGYHLSKDLVDKAISFIQDTTAIAPEKPWMMYFAPGANHAPHQIWPQKIVDYGYNTTLRYSENPKDISFEQTSIFKDGYEVYRKEVLDEMKRLGIFTGNFDPSVINPHNEGVLDKNYAGSDHTIVGVPEGKVWPQTDYVRPWDSLNQKEKALFIRMAEIYAAFSTYTDEQIGRLLDFLEKTGQMDNTIIIAVADNGASAEGGPNGSVNENLFFNDVADNFDKNFALLPDLGTDKTYNHYPTGWAWAFDTPFKYWKRWSGYEGGAATPFMICGPGIDKKTKDFKYEYRKQYVHAVDVVPTLYDCLNIEPPEVVKGFTQNPIEGISFKYTFAPEYGQPKYQFPYKDDALKPKDENGKPKKVRETQFYTMLGTRGIWYKGWHACTSHAPAPSDWGSFELDRWELYCMDGDKWLEKKAGEGKAVSAVPVIVPADPTQSTDLAEIYPKKLEIMKNMWFVQAGIYNGMPLDDRSAAVGLGAERPQLADPPDFTGGGDWPKGEFGYIYYPGGSEIPEAVAPNIRMRSYSITATVEDFSKVKNPAGVLLAHGGRFGGHSFYIHENRLCYVYNWLGQREQKVSCQLPKKLTGSVKLKVKFEKTGMLSADPTFGSSTLGNVSLFINDIEIPVAQIQHNLDSFADKTKPEDKFLTQPGKFALAGEGFNIGRDAGQPVSSDYATHIPYEFEGATLKQVLVTIKNDAETMNPEKEFQGMLLRD
ncbi:MAG: sulfatase-like hydrolase/transferase [Dolichospermum sp. DET50]|nr:sulfatase-like hydrolase/transferase [Dolichospermum sp. DET66]MBS3033582.1 sulfatase-like hydrolase/transferase [Dolichospermum sp. DET67]MBS3038784.1 sulfatase-like hydrolase/transferase [Dolichospermum sp. DET50]QSX66054.1 MAG: sulfatase-like hydrolase/transferase [Dolichospermum sp. DET69]